MSKNKSVFAALGTDPEKEKNGIEVTWYGVDAEIKVRIGRAGPTNVAFQAQASNMSAPYRRSGMTLEQLPMARQNEITRVLYADHIVMGWSGVYDDDGNEIPCTRENVIDVFKQLPDFMQFVIAEATNFQNFRRAAKENEAGN